MGHLCVELVQINKSYGPIQACLDVSLKLEAGKVHALLGDNGAGKSTLMKVLTGLVSPNSGSIIVGGKEYGSMTPKLAKQLKIAMVHQGFSHVEELTVWENIQISKEQKTFSFLSKNAKNAESGDINIFDLDMSAKVADLDMGERQQLEILKALNPVPNILILDEPAAFLDLPQTQQLQEMLVRLKAKGCCIALISHNLEQVLTIADEITILEEGSVTSHFQKPFPETLEYGAELARTNLASSISEIEEPILRVQNLSIDSQDQNMGFSNLNLTIHPSEVVALVDGGMHEALDGRKLLLDLFLGSVEPKGGKVYVDGQEVQLHHIGQAQKAKIGVIPEDRKRAGCIEEMTVAENLFLLNPLTSHHFLKKKAMWAKARELIQRYNISPGDPQALFSSLSGGNQQRVLLARELSSNPKLLVVGSLTEGLDVRASADIRWNIQRVAGTGVGVLLLTNDVELIGLAHKKLEIQDIYETL